VRLWDVRSGRLKSTLLGHRKGVRSLAYAPQYKMLLSAGFDYDINLWSPFLKRSTSHDVARAFADAIVTALSWCHCCTQSCCR
jgi:WD40 repeat protein